MADILTSEDFTSDRIRDHIDARYLTLANNRYSEILSEFGIYGDSLPVAASPKVKRILVLFVSMWVCRDRVGLSLQATIDGANEDPWEKLSNLYRRDYESALLTLTKENLLGETPDLDGMVGTIHRGG